MLAAALVVSSVVLATAIARTPVPDPIQGLAPGASVFAAPSGQSDGDGSRDRPLDLATALSGTGPVRPGTTLWLRGGTYAGVFRSDLAGTAAAPIVVRPYPDELAVIDSAPFAAPALTVWGAWTTYRDFEIVNSSPRRDSTQSDSIQPTDLLRGPGSVVHGPSTKLVNLVVHDLAGGLDIWSDAEGAEAYGNVIYDNGWTSPERNNGHGIYTQNKNGVRKLTDNIIFNQFGAGIHAYGSDAAFLDNLSLEGNVVFNNGALGGKYDRNILIGGGRPANHPVLVGNHTFFSSGRGRRFGQNNLGYLAGCSELDARDNYFTAAEFGFSLELVNCTGSLQRNTFVGEMRAVEGRTLVNHAVVKERFPQNTYADHQPAAVQVFVRPNTFEPGRANIIVYNGARQPSVEVDLSHAHLDRGAKFEVKDAQNVLGPPIVSGTYTGAPVTIPMTGLTVAAPIGAALEPVPHTGPEFAVFIVTPSPRSHSIGARAVAALHRVLP
jgi:parallel beta-helix repeat protein